MNLQRFAILGAMGRGLVACAGNPNVQPPIAGTQAATAGTSAAYQATDRIPQSQREATSAGTGTFSGTIGGGERAGAPVFTRTDPSGNQVGGNIPQQYTPSYVRPRGGGG